ncbi:hypothetical protein HDU83_002087 [Entophlyctis luteolus]|nr:hypothetical protein HDU83_002087 [Entophlyctis luteolus]
MATTGTSTDILAFQAVNFTVSLLTNCAVCSFMAWEKHVTSKPLATPFNFSLIVMGIAVSSNLSLSLYRNFVSDPDRERVYFILQSATSSVAQLCYVWYSWNRGWSMLEIASPRLYRLFKVMVFLMPLFTTLPVVFTIVAVYGPPGNIMADFIGVGGFSVAIFDLVLLGVFIYSLKTKAMIDIIGEDNRLKVISRYGIASSALMLSCLLILVTSISLNVPSEIQNYCFCASDSMLLLCYIVLFAMKARLYYLHKNHSYEGSSAKLSPWKISTNGRDRYSAVSHVWGSPTMKKITHVWGIATPDYVEINANSAKHAAIRWLYGRRERVWMDIFNNNQHDKKVISAQVAVMDILYGRSACCYIILECARAAMNFNKLMERAAGRMSLPTVLLPAENANDWEIHHYLIDCGADEWEDHLNDLLEGTVYRSRVWTLQEEIVSKNKVVILAYEENSEVIILSHTPLEDVEFNSLNVTTRKLRECSELYVNALIYRASGDVGYSTSDIKARAIANLRNYKRECFRPVDHVFAVNRLLGIVMDTDYYDAPEKILQEWQYKLMKAGILLPPYASHRTYRPSARQANSCWKSLYWVPPVPGPVSAAITKEADGKHQELHLEDAMKAATVYSTEVAAPGPSQSKIQSEVFYQAYYDSSLHRNYRVFDLRTKIAPSGLDLIVTEVSGPLMDREDSGVELSASREKKFLVVMKHMWTEIVPYSEGTAPSYKFYPHGNNFQKHTEDLVRLPDFCLATENGAARIAVLCESETCGPDRDKVEVLRLATEIPGSRYCVIVRSKNEKFIRVVGNLPFILPEGKFVSEHTFGGAEFMWE